LKIKRRDILITDVYIEKLNSWLEQYWESEYIDVDIANALVNSIPKLISQIKTFQEVTQKNAHQFDYLTNSLMGQDVEIERLQEEDNIYRKALQEIDIHIRSTNDPIPYIIQTLKETLPEYKEW
jgi:hypothetical protein